MGESVDMKSNENVPKDIEGITVLLLRMQRKLDGMEKKIDSLMRQPQPGSFKGKASSGSPAEFDRTKRPHARKYEGKKEEVSSEGKFYHGRPFGKKKDSGKSHVRKNKKPFSRSFK